MKEYNISTLIAITMDITAENQVNTGTILLEAVADHDSVRVNVDDKMISLLMSEGSSRKDVHESIKAGALRPDVLAFARNHLQEKLMPKISPLRQDDYCTQIIETMRADKKVSDGFCNTMQNLYANQQLLEFVTYADLYALSITNLLSGVVTSPEDMLFLTQESRYCPLDNAELWRKTRKKNSSYVYTYQIIKIYPENLPDDIRSAFDAIHLPPRSLDSDDNRIAVCKNCAKRYLDDPNPEDYRRLIEFKRMFKTKQARDKISSSSAIEDEIVTIIHAIAKIEGGTKLEPFTDVLKIKEKILPENYLLEEAVRDDVVKYYPFIETQFSLLDDVGTSTFNVIRSEVTTCYEKYEREGFDQNEIVYELTEWLLKANNLQRKLRIAAGIVVSFFIQNCAVFKPHNLNGNAEENAEVTI